MEKNNRAARAARIWKCLFPVLRELEQQCEYQYLPFCRKLEHKTVNVAFFNHAHANPVAYCRVRTKGDNCQIVTIAKIFKLTDFHRFHRIFSIFQKVGFTTTRWTINLASFPIFFVCVTMSHCVTKLGMVHHCLSTNIVDPSRIACIVATGCNDGREGWRHVL